MTIRSKQSGFSLVETLVAITILLIVIVGPMTISMQTAKSSSFASEQVTAFFLAQEGIELVEKARNDLQIRYFLPTTDSNYLPQPWTTNFSNTSGTYALCYAANGCGLSITDDDIGSLAAPQNCSTLTNCLLKFDPNTNTRAHYKHTSTSVLIATPYTRVISLQLINANEVRVVSRVSWRTGSLVSEQDVTVETRLFNVYGN